MQNLGATSEMREGDRSTPISERDAAFATFAERRLAAQYKLAAVILGDHSEAQDATHDAFELAWRRWDSLRDTSRLDAWFGRILINVCRDRLRTRHRHVVTDISTALAESLAAGDDLRATSDRDEIGRAFTKLSADHRVVIVLRFYADLSVDQIAERVGVPAGTVKSRLHYALVDLDRALAAGRHEEFHR